jgi:hypothetical protein
MVIFVWITSKMRRLLAALTTTCSALPWPHGKDLSTSLTDHSTILRLASLASYLTIGAMTLEAVT